MSPLHQTVIQSLVELKVEREGDVTLPVPPEDHLPPDVGRAGVLQGGLQVELSGNGLLT